MRWVMVAIVMLVDGCGGGTANHPAAAPAAAPPVATAPVPPPQASPPAITPEVLCDHLIRKSQICPQLAGFHVDMKSCVADFAADLTPPTVQPRSLEIATCVVTRDACNEIIACIANGRDPTSPTGLRACGDHARSTDGHAVAMPRSAWDQRNGVGVTTFHAARSRKLRPIEQCGVAAATDWLVSLRCDDGSQPIKGVNDAEAARSGNVGQGGRCGSIIDRYLVACPEQRYEIFIDAYLCPTPD